MKRLLLITVLATMCSCGRAGDKYSSPLELAGKPFIGSTKTNAIARYGLALTEERREVRFPGGNQPQYDFIFKLYANSNDSIMVTTAFSEGSQTEEVACVSVEISKLDTTARVAIRGITRDLQTPEAALKAYNVSPLSDLWNNQGDRIMVFDTPWPFYDKLVWHRNKLVYIQYSKGVSMRLPLPKEYEYGEDGQQRVSGY